ncbi:TATA element modulatory factor [Toxorhynchites rutilus septentrionalis]|uniref:TATA element modulatory factor n=1 Tax=Toxorhynchites rutilus septentrionalis TaxID=329112 RepID=UPI0024791185|nr:TATA element modulatory factor [Toxorhynchites rutilus septentrionalis]
MSWFDTTGIANLAKTALKEAQKQIDKALDIKEEEGEEGGVESRSGAIASARGGSKTEPCTPVSTEAKGGGNVGKGQVDSIWGSFTGSFFEQPITTANVTVTKAPSSLKRKSFEDSGMAEVPKCSFKEDPATSGSPENSSESIELLSPVTTPGSALTSPSSGLTVQESESVEIMKVLGTPSSISSPESITTMDQSPIETDGARFMPADLEDDDISVEEDSMSYTLSEQPITVMETSDTSGAPVVTVAPSRSSLHLSLEKTSTTARQMTFSEMSVCDTEDSNDSEATVTSVDKQSKLSDDQMEKSYENVEIQTQISDSTHSFEEIQAVHIPLPMDSKQHEASSSHNSGDEIETATSSDIEVISSPNGDSSSTHSGAYRASPLKIPDGKSNIDIMMIKKRGHNREPSEVSLQSGNSDDVSETERLLRRITEVSEILEQREYRLLELGRQNAELHEQNCLLNAQLESKQKRADSSESEEYTQRLSALEKKFQQSIREREALKRQMDAARIEAQGKISRTELAKVVAEKDCMIEELKKEGENLSKQVLNHSNITKKLRLKERENEAQIKKLKEDIDDLTDETERLKRSLSAKEEVERSQIDAVHKLSSEKKKLEKEKGSLKSQLEDQTQKFETLRNSFDFAKKELSEKTEAYQELVRKSSLLASMESEHSHIQRVNEQLGSELEDLREKLRQAEAECAQRIQRLKNENSELLQRVEEVETRAEEEKNATAMVTVPLMKQIESLQNALRNKERLWEQREADSSRKLDDALEKSKVSGDNERGLKEQIFSLNGRISNLEERLTGALFRSEELTNNLQQKQIEMNLLESDYKAKLKIAEDDRKSFKCRLSELEAVTADQDRKLLQKNEQLESLRQHQQQQQQHTGHHKQETATMGNRQSPPSPSSQGMLGESRTSSPTPSMGNLSLPESIGSIPWNQVDDEMGSVSGRQTIGGAPLLHTTSLLENLQATLKQRDGEVYQLQWEQSRFQQERNVLNAEISNLTVELENLREKADRCEKLEEEFAQLQERYDALLQLYGEAVEKTEELKLDLVDVKEMYKLQIDDLLLQVAEGSKL